MPYDERDLFSLARDVTDRSGCFGPALAWMHGLAVGMRAQSLLELGVGKGGSTRALLLAAARTGGHLISVDPDPAIRANVPAELHQFWTLITGRSDDPAVKRQVEDLLWEDDDGYDLDLLLIDSDHRYEVATVELDWYGRMVRPGGVIIMDDCWDLFPGVLAAYKEHHNSGEGRWLMPYGQRDSDPGGLDRTLGVLWK